MKNGAMRLLALAALSLGTTACTTLSHTSHRPTGVVAGCQEDTAAPAAAAAADDAPPAPVVVGGDRDAHGCIASAGYSWCSREAACVRPWELARDKGLANGAEAFDTYCIGGDN